MQNSLHTKQKMFIHKKQTIEQIKHKQYKITNIKTKLLKKNIDNKKVHESNHMKDIIDKT